MDSIWRVLFAVYVSMVDIPNIFACQVTDPWRHKSYLWRHRCDTASSMSTIRPKHSTEMHKKHPFCVELNGEHAGEGPMPLRYIVLLILTRKVEKSKNFRKFDLWPAITGSNIHLGAKIIQPIASTRREQSSGFSAKLYDSSFGNAKGGRTPPPCPTEGGETPYPGAEA